MKKQPLCIKYSRILCIGLLMQVICLTASAQVKVISDFETPASHRLFNTKSASVQWMEHPEAATSGKGVLKVTLAPGGSYPGIDTSPSRGMPADWGGYDRLNLDFYNPGNRSITLYIRIDDAQSRNYATRYNSPGWGLRPGTSTLSIPIRQLKTQDGSRPINLSQIRALYLFGDAVAQPVEFYLDSFRLEKHSEMDLGAEGQFWFDFGSADSPLWQGFQRITPQTVYDESRGFGFLSKDRLYVENLEAPDPLAQDCVTGNVWQDYEYGFAIRVKPGKYGVRVIARHVSPVKLPMRSGSITAKGQEVYRTDISPEVFYSEQVLYRGLARPYRLGQDAWAKFFSPEMDWKSFEVEATDGQVNLVFSNLAVFALVVFPLEDEAQIEEQLAQLDQARRNYFHEHVYYEESGTPTPYSPRDEETQRGFAARVVPFWQQVSPWSRPGDFEPDTAARMLVTRGEWEPVTFAITPLQDIQSFTVQISDATSEDQAVLTSDRFEARLVHYREVRRMKGVFVPSERYMTRMGEAVPLQKDLTQRVWITLHVPPNQPAGIYRGEISFSNETDKILSIPLEIEVLPLTLSEKTSLSFAWYYRDPGEFNYHLRRVPGDREHLWRERLEQELRDMKEHGCTSFQFMDPVIQRVDNQHYVQFSFARWDEMAQIAKRVGLGVEHPPQTFIINIANRLSQSGVKEGSENFSIAYRNAVSRLMDWTHQHQFPLVFWVVDEPREQLKNSWNRSLAETRFLLQTLKTIPDIQTTVTPMADVNYGVNYLPMLEDLHIVQTHPWSDSARMMRRARERSIPVWYYNAGSDRLSFGFHPWATQAQGRWQWHYAFWSDPYNPFVEGWGVTYPSPEGPLPTPAYELTREGTEDYRWLETLEARLKNSPEHPAAPSARALLDFIRKEIPTYLDYSLTTGEEEGEAYRGKLEAQMPLWREQILRNLVLFES